MSKSTPTDLAVSFRSLARRMGQAVSDDTPPDALITAKGEVQGAIGAAASVVGSPATAEDLASAIESRNLREWTEADLDALQTHANDAARAIRALSDASER
jgi:type IV secretory pathway ATPase VirB11/archaellum biosynthesis ATPase